MGRGRLAVIPPAIPPVDDITIGYDELGRLYVKDSAITTEKIANNAVTPPKAHPTVLVVPIEFDHTKTSVTLAAGAHRGLISVMGIGSATTMFVGDGDPTITMQILVDRKVQDELPANQPHITINSFTNSFEIRAFNPAVTTITGYTSSCSVRSVRRPISRLWSKS